MKAVLVVIAVVCALFAHTTSGRIIPVSGNILGRKFTLPTLPSLSLPTLPTLPTTTKAPAETTTFGLLNPDLLTTLAAEKEEEVSTTAEPLIDVTTPTLPDVPEVTATVPSVPDVTTEEEEGEPEELGVLILRKLQDIEQRLDRIEKKFDVQKLDASLPPPTDLTEFARGATTPSLSTTTSSGLEKLPSFGFLPYPKDNNMLPPLNILNGLNDVSNDATTTASTDE